MDFGINYTNQVTESFTHRYAMEAPYQPFLLLLRGFSLPRGERLSERLHPFGHDINDSVHLDSVDELEYVRVTCRAQFPQGILREGQEIMPVGDVRVEAEDGNRRRVVLRMEVS